jgi:hypothetical protein
VIARRRLAWHAGIARAPPQIHLPDKKDAALQGRHREWIEISVRVGVAIGWLEPMQGRGASGGPAAIQAVERRRIAEPADDRPHRAKQAGAAQKQTSHYQNRTVRLSASAFAIHIQTVRYRARPLLGSTWLPDDLRKTAFPIAQSMTTAVRASKTFRRVSASETLNACRRSASGKSS